VPAREAGANRARARHGQASSPIQRERAPWPTVSRQAERWQASNVASRAATACFA
jgi:hypothetical protein